MFENVKQVTFPITSMEMLQLFNPRQLYPVIKLGNVQIFKVEIQNITFDCYTQRFMTLRWASNI